METGHSFSPLCGFSTLSPWPPERKLNLAPSLGYALTGDYLLIPSSERSSRMTKEVSKEPLPFPFMLLQEQIRAQIREESHISIEDCVLMIQKCVKDKCIHHASGLYLYFCMNGLESHAILGNKLISMWVEVGSILDAERCFYKSGSVSDSLCCSLANAYLQFGDMRNAFCLCHMMQEDTVYQFRVLIDLLKACSKFKDVGIGYEIHAEIIERGFIEINPYLGSSLVDMYAKCGLLSKAQQVFNLLHVRDVVPWTALISGYVQHDNGTEALNCFEQMQSEGITPNDVTFTWILKACAGIGAILKGMEIHNEIVKKDLLRKNQILGNALVDMYVKCGNLAKAQEVFDDLLVHDVISWTTLISGYVKYEQHSENALNCFKNMQLEGIQPDAFIFTCVLKACSNLRAIEQGKQIHFEIVEKGLLKGNLFLGNALVDMYAKCGFLTKAAEVFHFLPAHDVASWNALICAYVQHECATEALSCLDDMQKEGISPDVTTYACVLKGCGIIGAIGRGYVQHEWNGKALACFEKMQLEGICPDAFSFTCSLKACGNIGAINDGRKIHTDIAKKGLLESNIAIGNALLDMYAKCGLLAEALEIFKELHIPDVVSWTALISGYVDHKLCKEALDCFDQMKLEGIAPNTITFACSLRACGSIGDIEKGREMHSELVGKGLLEENDIVLDTTLVDMYSKIGFLLEAKYVFDTLGVQDVVVCTALIAGYAAHEQEEEALSHFNQMQLIGLSPSEFTYACILKACGSLGAIDMGRKIHCDIEKKALLDNNLVIGTALIDMYSKCGLLKEAQIIFDELRFRDPITWNSLITGYAQLGETEVVLSILEKMRADGNEPDAVTFLCIMNSCCHAGLVEEGEMYFGVMRKWNDITPTLEHYTCMVDLFGRAGQLDKMATMMEETSLNSSVVMWLAVLAACRRYANIEIGRQAFEQVTQLDKKGASAYICMYNIYADADK